MWILSALVLIVGLVAPAVSLPAAAAPAAFVAEGSVNQVYVTGLAGGAIMSLLDAKGATVATQSADPLGGLLFRNVPAGRGYRVRPASGGRSSPPLTVHTAAAAPWDPSIYDQSIPDNGYTYLTTRDGTQLAIDVHPPTSPAGEPGLPASVKVPDGPDFATSSRSSGSGQDRPASVARRI